MHAKTSWVIFAEFVASQAAIATITTNNNMPQKFQLTTLEESAAELVKQGYFTGGKAAKNYLRNNAFTRSLVAESERPIWLAAGEDRTCQTISKMPRKV